MQELEEFKETAHEELKKGVETLRDRLFNLMQSFLTKLDLLDAVVYGGLSVLGFDKLPNVFPDVVKLLWGPIALKLATTSSESSFSLKILGTGVEVPVNSQIVGLTMLGYLGFATLPWEEIQKALYDKWWAVANPFTLATKAMLDWRLTGGELGEMDRLKAILGRVFSYGTPAQTIAAAIPLNSFLQGLQAKYGTQS